MNKHIIHLLLGTLLLSALAVPVACERVAPQGETAGPSTVSRARMDVTIDRWDATKADVIDSWPDWSIIFIQLTNGKQTMTVEAEYDPGGVWNIYRSDRSVPDLTGYSGGRCKCYYFENTEGTNGQSFSRQEDGTITVEVAADAIYYDDDALFSVVDGVLELKVHLEPMTGRIRIAPSPLDDYHYPGIYGLLRYTALHPDTFEMDSTMSYYDYYISNDRAAPFLYCSFADPERRTLTIVDNKYGAPGYFERSFDEDILAPGLSNWSYMPTEDDHNEWYRHVGSYSGWELGIDGLTMRYIVPGTFRMGGENAQPVHSVTLTKGYYISQTEITQDMWYQVMGEPSEYANASVPVVNKTWDEVQTFIAALNAKTGYSFRLPTEAEWEYAARGGQKSKGYLYSGSNSTSEVAVRDWNWTMMAVKTKSPNELELYDMSGNAAEWVNDWYGPYPSGAVVDPKGPETGEIHVRRGGNRGQEDRYLSVTFRDIDSIMEMTGFRLAMDAPRIQ